MLWSQQSSGGTTTIVPQLNTNGSVAGIYQVPGTNGAANPPANVNVPYTTNGSNLFNQAVESSDWWSNLMFRTDPTTVGAASFQYANRYLFSDPGVLRLQNQLFNAATGDWVQGLGIFNPDTFGIDPGPQGPQATTQRSGSTSLQVTPLTVGIGSGKEVMAGVDNGAIAPLDTTSATNVDEAQLMTRVNHYSDWGVQLVYGDGTTPQAANDPAGETNTLTIDMINGSPFIDFTKTGPAPADVWLTTIGPGGTNQIWGRDIARSGAAARTSWA